MQQDVAAKIDAWLASLQDRTFEAETAKEQIDAIKWLVRRAGGERLYEGKPVTLHAICAAKRSRNAAIQVHHQRTVLQAGTRFPRLDENSKDLALKKFRSCRLAQPQDVL